MLAPRLETERLVLRTPTLDDAVAVQRFADDPAASWCGYSVPHPYTIEHARQWIVKGGEQLDAEHRGNGFAVEAARAVVEFGFDALALHKIEANCWGRNAASSRVLEKLGFVREGVLREHALKWGRREDDVCYGLLRREWRAE